MKKIFAVLVALIMMVSSMAFAMEGDASYFVTSIQTMTLANEFKDKVIAMGGKPVYTKMEVELSLRYAEAWGMIMNVAYLEMEAASSDTPSGKNELGEYLELVEKLRTMYELGLVSGEEVVNGMAAALQDA